MGAVDFLSGFALPVEAARLLRREAGLRNAAILPALLSAVALVAGLSIVIVWAGDVYALAAGWLPDLEATRWYAWIWVGPGKLLLGIAGLLLFAAAAGGIVVGCFVLATLLGAPFHELLSRRVEVAVAGRAVDLSPPGIGGFVSSSARAVLEDSKRIGAFLSLQAVLALAGAAIPPAAPVVAPAMILLAIAFLPLEYAGYALDRRGFSFQRKREWLSRNLAACLGFGAAGFLLCSVPVLNLVAMPVLVVGGTLLVLRARDAR